MTRKEHNTEGLRLSARILEWMFVCGVVLIAALAGDWAVRTAANDYWLNQAQQTSNDQLVIDDLSRAAAWRPDLAKAWRLLADRTAIEQPNVALADAERAVALAPHGWQNWASLAMIQVQQSHLKEAAQSARRITTESRAFGAYATAAGIDVMLGRNDRYLRDLTDAFQQANPEQAISLLATAVHVLAGTPELLIGATSRIPPESLPAVIDALTNADHLDLAFPLSRNLQCTEAGADACRGTVLHLADKLSTDLYFHRAWVQLKPEMVRVWNTAVAHHWLNQTAISSGEVGDSQFQHPFAGPGFDWAIRNKDQEIHIQQVANGNSHLEITFSGYESASSVLLQQFVLVNPEQTYSLSMTARSQTATRGILINVIDQGNILATLRPSLTGTWGTSSLSVRVPKGCPELLLSVEYQRPYGQPSLEQTVALRQVRLVQEDVP